MSDVAVNQTLNAQLLNDYLAQEGPRCVQLGTGFHLLPGWLNTDLQHNNEQTFALDVTKPFPLPDGRFDYAFCEHMIEHITLPEAQMMLSECYRVLKPGGVLRIATPALGFLMRLLGTDRSDLEEDYIRWAWENNFAGSGPPNIAVVVNGFMRNWGHQFIYDHKTLKGLLFAVGFIDVEECGIQDSRHTNLSGIEFEQRMPRGFLALESMIYEGTRPTVLAANGA